MQNKVLLTVVIPAYNVEETIEKAVSSILVNNTYNVEIIIVNDGSLDNTLEKCNELVLGNKNNKNLIKIVSQGNRGHGSAINFGIKNASGKYMRILDGDDYFNEKDFKLFLEFLATTNVDLVLCDYIEKRKKGEKKIVWNKHYVQDRMLEEIIKGSEGVLLAGATVKTEVLRNAGEFVDEKCYYDDQEYDCLMMANCETASYIDNAAYVYVNDNILQSVSEKSFMKNSLDHARVCKWMLKKYSKAKNKIGKNTQEVLKIRIVGLCYQQYYIMVTLKKNRGEFLVFDKELKKYSEFYRSRGVAGKKIWLHRLTRGIFI